MFHISHFINDTSFQMTYINNELNIINYSCINYMEDNKISLSDNNRKILIKGENMRVKKLLESEILVVGLIQSIEFVR